MKNVGKLPQARQDELFVEQLDEGLLVYDAKHFCAHRLNPTASWVWQRCDGQQTVADTTRLLSAELGQPLDEELIWLSLDTLDKARLLSSPIQRPAEATSATGATSAADAPGESRRAMLQKMALAGGMMFLLPTVTALTKTARAQDEGAPAGAAETGATDTIRATITSAPGQKNRHYGVSAVADWGIGVSGQSANSIGVRGSSDTARGIYGYSRGKSIGVHGSCDNGDGVQGESTIGNGVKARCNGTGTALYAEHSNNGRAGYFKGDVEVTGDIRLLNADCAEDFDLVDADVEPGTVMVLGEEGSLHLSQHAYDKRVAGVISGAGDYKPGLILDKKPTGRPRKPVALMGKVFCKADASYGPIAAGDLLTTSATPGHAMKATDASQAFGAIVGKALRGLPDGQGLIPILVSLQ